MANKAKVAQAVSDALDNVQSLKDLGFRHAKHRDLDGAFRAKFVAMVGTADKDKVPEESRDEVFAGYMMRFNELHPAVRYIREGEDTYIPVATDAPAKGEVIEVSIAYAMSYSTHEFGRLKPALKKIVGAWREKFSTYRSDRWNDLFKVKTQRERGATKTFADRMKKTCEDMQKQNKVALLVRKDPTAVSVEKLKAAWAAFFNALK
jgi:hypothetical protein